MIKCWLRSLLISLSFAYPFFPICPAAHAETPNPKQLIQESERQTLGDSSASTVELTVNHDHNERKMRFKFWSSRRDKAVIKVMEPIKDRDTGNLRLNLDLWQYLPNVERIIKVPTSMMLQSWMGSDFSNDDLVKTTSLSQDYTHLLIAREKKGGYDTYKILCTPKPDAPIAWGKVLIWLTTSGSVPVQQEFYNEKGELVKIMKCSQLKRVGTHTVPTVLEMSVPGKGAWSTTFRYQSLVFDKPLPDTIFTQEYLRIPVRK